METLAIKGGTPVYIGSFPKWPVWGREEEENLLKVLDSHSWGTLGTFAMSFAKRFAEFCGAAHAIPVNSGTQALELILRAAGIGRGDDVIVPPYTFDATVSAVLYVGAMPVFADVDPVTGNIDPESVRRHVTPRTKAVIAVHVGGYPCDMDALQAVAKEAGILLIEDAAHAHGASWRGRKAGSLGDIAEFSFQCSKTLPCGEGGMIVTGNEELFAKCWQYHHSGRTIAGRESVAGNTLMGTNGRMAEWEAAVLDAQMDRFPAQSARRQANVDKLLAGLKGVRGIVLPPDDERVTSRGNLIFQFIWNGPLSRADFVKAVQAEGIPVGGGYELLTKMGMMHDPSLEKWTGRKFEQDEPLPNAEAVSKGAVWIMNAILLSEPDVMDLVVKAIRKVAENC